jgi:cytochrome P450
MEALRLHPSVPRDGKVCLSDDTLPTGHSVSAGDFISYDLV